MVPDVEEIHDLSELIGEFLEVFNLNLRKKLFEMLVLLRGSETSKETLMKCLLSMDSSPLLLKYLILREPNIMFKFYRNNLLDIENLIPLLGTLFIDPLNNFDYDLEELIMILVQLSPETLQFIHEKIDFGKILSSNLSLDADQYPKFLHKIFALLFLNVIKSSRCNMSIYTWSISDSVRRYLANIQYDDLTGLYDGFNQYELAKLIFEEKESSDQKNGEGDDSGVDESSPRPSSDLFTMEPCYKNLVNSLTRLEPEILNEIFNRLALPIPSDFESSEREYKEKAILNYLLDQARSNNYRIFFLREDGSRYGFLFN